MNIDQIAAEAWMDVRANAWQLSGDHNAIGIGIIKAAIEKAVKDEVWKRGYDADLAVRVPPDLNDESDQV